MLIPQPIALAAAARLLIFALSTPAVCTGVSLRDHPIISGLSNETVYLDSKFESNGDVHEWHANNSAGVQVRAAVPGDLLTDLEREGLIDDPLWGRTFQSDQLATYAAQAWTYSTMFELNSTATVTTTAATRTRTSQVAHIDEKQVWLLVLDGVKMGAVVRLNGKEISRVANQFLRYVVPISIPIHVPKSHHQEYSLPTYSTTMQRAVDDNSAATDDDDVVGTIKQKESNVKQNAHMNSINYFYEDDNDMHVVKHNELKDFFKDDEDEDVDVSMMTELDTMLTQTLSLDFGDGSVDEQGRFMACSGGWDWAPYSRTTDQHGAATSTLGIYKSVYIVKPEPVAILHVVPLVFYVGEYPTQPMCEPLVEISGQSIANNANGNEMPCVNISWKFRVETIVHAWSPRAQSCALGIRASWLTPAQQPIPTRVNIEEGHVTLQSHASTVVATSQQVRLWWPVGVGNQPLYNVTARLTECTIKVSSKEGSENVLRTKAKKKNNDSNKNSNINKNYNKNNNYKKNNNNNNAQRNKSNSKQEQHSYDSLVVESSRRVGFRVFALVTGNDTAPGYANTFKNIHNTGQHGMYWRVNGALIMSRGANMIPMEAMEARSRADALRQLVLSTRDAKLNTLRVWGGGVFLPQVWYDACDELGIMVYHDMAYAQRHHSPNASSATQTDELKHQVRRLAYHPSIVMWDGCNECVVRSSGPTSVYASFVMRVVGLEDPTRAIWPSSPAKGWRAGVDRLYSRAAPSEFVSKSQKEQNNTKRHKSGSNFFQNPTKAKPQLTLLPRESYWDPSIETHGPYQHGSGWPSVNAGFSYPMPVDTLALPPHITIPDDNNDGDITGVKKQKNINSKSNGKSSNNHNNNNNNNNKYEPLIVTTMGPHLRNSFVSEFGSSTMSSFESFSPTLKPQHWGLHGGAKPNICSPDYGTPSKCVGNNTMAERNYPCDSLILAYFGDNQHVMRDVGLNLVGEAVFRAQLYLCMTAQAIHVKGQIERFRAQGNHFGLLVWQLNEIWPTGGWGSLEYGNPRMTGQVLGGRWKPLHHLYRTSIMADVTVICGPSKTRTGAACLVKNDSPKAFHGIVAVYQIKCTLSASSDKDLYPFVLRGGQRTGSISISGSGDEAPSSSIMSLVLNETVSLLPGAGSAIVLHVNDTPGPFMAGYQNDQREVVFWLSHAVRVVHGFKRFKQFNGYNNGYNGQLESHNVHLPSRPRDFLRHWDHNTAVVSCVVADTVNTDGSVNISVTLEHSDLPALFVYLTTSAHGRFSDNSFMLLPNGLGRSECAVQKHLRLSTDLLNEDDCSVVKFIPFVLLDGDMLVDELKRTIQVQHATAARDLLLHKTTGSSD